VKKGNMVLAHISSLVDNHLRVCHPGGLPAEGAAAEQEAAKKKAQRQSKLLANQLGFVAAVVQSTPPPAKTATPAKGSVGSGSLLSPIDTSLTPDGGDYVMLMLPMDKPVKGFEGERRSKLFASEYLKVQSKGKMVCDDTFDLLRRIEMASYLERSPIALKDVVLLVHRFDTAKLIKACTEEARLQVVSSGHRRHHVNPVHRFLLRDQFNDVNKHEGGRERIFCVDEGSRLCASYESSEGQWAVHCHSCERRHKSWHRSCVLRSVIVQNSSTNDSYRNVF